MKTEQISKMIKKTIFVGTPEFSVPTLLALTESEFRPELVITQPDRPKGRKLILTPPPVKIIALEKGLKVIQPENINSEEVISMLKSFQPDIIITISYGGFIGKEIRKIPPYGVINIHPSILPKYRGSTPIQTAIINGDDETAITIFKITAKMDAGPILFQRRYPIKSDMNFTQLDDFLASKSADDLLDFLRYADKLVSIDDYNRIMTTQCIDNVSYTSKVARETLRINWHQEANIIYHYIRAFSESPGAFTTFREKELKILKTSISSSLSKQCPGTLFYDKSENQLLISTQSNDLIINQVQPQGKKIMNIHDFINGYRIQTGDIFI